MALQWMRDQFKLLRWVLWVVIATFVIFFGANFSGLGQGDTTRIAAWIGKEQISTQEVRDQYRRLEDYYRQLFREQFNPDLAKQMNLTGQALQAVVRQRLLLREARDLGLTATDQELRDTVLGVPWLQDQDGHFVGAKEYAKRVRRQARMDPAAFEARVREDLLMRKLEAVLQDAVYISDAELEQRYREQAEKVKIRYLLMPNSEFSNIELDNAALQSYLDAHLEAFQLPEQRTVDYLLIDAIKLRQELEVPDDELHAFYNQHLEDYTSEEQVLARHILLEVGPERTPDDPERKLRELRQRIEAGEDFGALAREYSEDPDSASRGGSLGWFGKNANTADFTEIVFEAEKGALIGPVRTQHGFHLIEIQDHRPGGARPFEDVRAQIRNRLVGERANELAETRASDLGERLGQDHMSEEAFRTFADGEGLEVATTEPFGARDVVPGIGRGPFVETAFGLERDGVSAPVKLPRGWAILRLDDILPPRSPSLEEVADRVRPAALIERQRQAAKEKLEAARARLEASQMDFDGLAKELGVELQESAEFSRGGTVPGLGNQPELVTAALAGEVGTLGGPFAVPQGAVLFEVSERTHFDAKAFADEKQTFGQTQRTARLDQVRAAILGRRSRDLELRYNPQALERLGVDPGRLPS